MRTGRPRTGVTIACAHCGKDVYRHPSTVGRTMCSRTCKDAAKMAKRVNEAEGTAKCAKCGEWKQIEEFVKGTGGRPHSYCKPCSSNWFAQRRGTDPEVRKPYRAAFRLTDEQRKQQRLDASRRNHLRRRGAGKPPHKFDLARMLCLQDAKCAYCRKLLTEYHIDHKTPVSRGGTNDIENLQMTCPKCNMQKGAMNHEEFLTCKRRKVTNWK